MANEPLTMCDAPSVAETERLRDGLRHERRVCHGDERDEVYAALEACRLGRGRMEREAGLPHPARPREREQALVLEQRIDAGHLTLAPNEAGERDGELH